MFAGQFARGAEAAAADPASVFWQSLHPERGNVDLPNGIITLHLGDAYYDLDAKETERVLVEAWGIVLTYAADGQFDDSDARDIDYTEMHVRSLGRKGVLEVNFVAGMAQLPEIQQNINAMLAVPEYKAGNRYIDFDPDLDEVAAYGIGALVAGKVAAKVGLLAGGLLLLKKFGVLLAVAAAGAFRWLRGRRKTGPPPPPV